MEIISTDSEETDADMATRQSVHTARPAKQTHRCTHTHAHTRTQGVGGLATRADPSTRHSAHGHVRDERSGQDSGGGDERLCHQVCRAKKHTLVCVGACEHGCLSMHACLRVCGSIYHASCARPVAHPSPSVWARKPPTSPAPPDLSTSVHPPTSRLSHG